MLDLYVHKYYDALRYHPAYLRRRYTNMRQKGKHLPANVKPTFSPVNFWKSFKSALNDLPCESIFWKCIFYLSTPLNRRAPLCRPLMPFMLEGLNPRSSSLSSARSSSPSPALFSSNECIKTPLSPLEPKPAVPVLARPASVLRRSCILLRVCKPVIPSVGTPSEI